MCHMRFFNVQNFTVIATILLQFCSRANILAKEYAFYRDGHGHFFEHNGIKVKNPF